MYRATESSAKLPADPQVPACCNTWALREAQNRRRFLMEPTVIREMSGN
jgi:hypothetical protein